MQISHYVQWRAPELRGPSYDLLKSAIGRPMNRILQKQDQFRLSKILGKKYLFREGDS